MARYRFYRNGDLLRSAKVSTNTGKAWIDEYQADYCLLKNATEINRVSPLELFVVTTGGQKLRWIITEGDGVNL